MTGVGLATAGPNARSPPARDRGDCHASERCTLRDATVQGAAVTARTMGYRMESSPLPDEEERSDTLLAVPELVGPGHGCWGGPTQTGTTVARDVRIEASQVLVKEFRCCYCVLGQFRPG